MLTRVKFKGIDGRAPPGVEPAAQFDSTRENLPDQDIVRIDRLKFFLDSMNSSAWPFLVGGVVRLVNSDNERDPSHLTSRRYSLALGSAKFGFLEGPTAFSSGKRGAITGQ